MLTHIRCLSIKKWSSWRSLVFLLVLAGVSCSKNNDGGSTGTIAQVKTTMQSGTWRITKFIDSGTDETSDFSGYSFTFAGSGSLTASGATTYTGTWSVTNSSGNDDSSNDIDFNIYFPLTNDFEDLNEDWDIVSRSSTRLELVHVSGGNGGTDYLTFARN